MSQVISHMCLHLDYLENSFLFLFVSNTMPDAWYTFNTSLSQSAISQITDEPHPE